MQNDILWVQDLDPRGSSGGAAITDSYYVAHFEKLGYRVIWEQDPLYALTDSTYKFRVAIICNAKWTANNYSMALKEKLVEKGIPWIKHEHDHACKWRALFPKISRCQREDCPSKITYGWQYEEAAAIIYLSPLHKEMHDYWNGFKLRKVPTLITPPYIPFMEFGKGRSGEREEGTVMLLAGMYDFKGYYTNLHYAIDNPHLKYNNYTRQDVFNADEIATMDKFNMAPLGGLPPHDVAKFMQKHEFFLHKSDGFLPFERVVMEAYFAGCKVITNRNVGATSYPWFGNKDGSIKAMDETRGKFVSFVEDKMK